MKPDKCIGCPAYNEEGPVYSSVSPNPRIIFVLEAPGEEEVKQGAPVVGPAGGLLWMMAAKVGIYRRDCIIMNTARCVTKDPGAWRFCWQRWSKEEFESYPKDLPVVAFGNAPKAQLVAQMASSGITKCRGSKFGRVTLALHPSFIRRTARFEAANTPEGEGGQKQDLSPTLCFDIASALDQGTFTHERRYWHQINVEPPGNDFVSSDIETANTLDPRKGPVTQLGFGHGPGQVHREAYSEGHRALYQRIFDTRQIVWHNGLYFDEPYLEYYGYKFRDDNEDTMVAAHLLHPDFPLGLEFLNSIYVHYPPWKHIKRTNPGDYHATDLDTTFISWGKMKLELQSRGLWNLYQNEDKPVAHACALMSKQGFKIDVEQMRKIWLMCALQLKKLDGALSKMAPGVNFSAAVQVIELLYDKLKLPPKFKKGPRGERGPRTADADALEELAKETQHPIVKLILGHRQWETFQSRYCDFPVDDKGFWHFDLAFTTATGRARGFLLTVPRVNVNPMVRRLFLPDDPEWEIIAADWKSVELWISAIQSGDRQMQEKLQDGKFHIWVGSQAFNYEVKKGTEDYENAKHIDHGWNYGRTARGIARDHDIPLARAEAVINTLKTGFPLWYKYREERTRQAHSEGYLTNAFGFTRFFWAGNVDGMSKAFDPQSVVAHMMKRCSMQLQSELPKPARLVFPFHDCAVVASPKSMRTEVVKVMKGVLEQEWPQLGGWHAECGFGYGNNLAEATS